MLDCGAVIFAVLIVNYVSIEGRSNYFLGSALIFIWALLISAFYFVPVVPEPIAAGPA
jgi:Ca2+/H+ antiporter